MVTVPSLGVEPISISGLLLRRAVLGTLLAADGPMSPAEVAAALRAAGATTSPALTKGPSRVIADLLTYQVRIGRVVKVGPALFAAVPSRISRSTRQRCLGWRRQFEVLVEGLAQWEAAHPALSQPESHVCPSPPLSDASGASERGGPSPRLDDPRAATGYPRRGCGAEHVAGDDAGL